MKNLRFPQAVALFILSALAMSVWAQGEKPLRIGFIGPFTGPSADYGVPMLNGAQLAVDQFNAAGGYLGRSIELVVKDDTAKPEVGVQRSKELLQEDIVATVGFCNTGVALKSIEVFQMAKMPLVIPCSTGTPITAKYPAAESYIFRVAARDSIQAQFVVNDIVSRGWTRVAIFADKTGYGEAGLKDVVEALTAKGLKPTHIARFDLGVKDLQQELREAQAAGANVVFSYTVGPEIAVIAKGRKAMGWRVPQVGAWSLSAPNFINAAEDAADGALMAQTFIAEPSNERRSSFLSAYGRKYSTTKITVPMAAAQGYDAMYLLMYAILSIRNYDLSGASIKHSLENLQRNYYGVIATHERPFSEYDHDAISANMLVMGVVKNGAVTFAYDADRTRNLFVQRKK